MNQYFCFIAIEAAGTTSQSVKKPVPINICTDEQSPVKFSQSSSGIKEQLGKKRKMSPQEKLLEQETAEHEKRMELIRLQISNEEIQHSARMENIFLERDLIKRRLENIT